ncbi:MAG: DNA-deoxyinosine glycosylase [Clostridia bacterium]|nr:DNA-deoxyinosine glycosylase [Clostridia bacterium]
MTKEPERITHPIPPFYNENSKILILGSFPSVKSREQMFFYGHPQNRFWRVLAGVFEKDVPKSIEEKKTLLDECNVALWDVLAECEILGSADSTIKNVKANDLSKILKTADIRLVYTNGKTAEKYYNKFLKSKYQVKMISLPSTSPANAAKSLEKLICEWQIIKDF